MTPATPQPRSSRRQEAHSPRQPLRPVQGEPGATLAHQAGEGLGVRASDDAFRAQVAHWADRIRVKPRQVRIQPMRRKWASCSSRGTVSFNADLLTQPADFQEYVIVHELLHLKVPNHGKLFKSLLRAYLPSDNTIRLEPK